MPPAKLRSSRLEKLLKIPRTFLAGGPIKLTFPKEGQFADAMLGASGKAPRYSPANSWAEVVQDGNIHSLPATLTFKHQLYFPRQ